MQLAIKKLWKANLGFVVFADTENIQEVFEMKVPSKTKSDSCNSIMDVALASANKRVYALIQENKEFRQEVGRIADELESYNWKAYCENAKKIVKQLRKLSEGQNE